MNGGCVATPRTPCMGAAAPLDAAGTPLRAAGLQGRLGKAATRPEPWRHAVQRVQVAVDAHRQQHIYSHVLDQAGVSAASTLPYERERALLISYGVAQPDGDHDAALPTALSGRVCVHEYSQLRRTGRSADPAGRVGCRANAAAAAATAARTGFGAGTESGACGLCLAGRVWGGGLAAHPHHRQKPHRRNRGALPEHADQRGRRLLL